MKLPKTLPDKTLYMICKNSLLFLLIKKTPATLKIAGVSYFRPINYKAAFAASTTTVKASLSLTARSASIFLLTWILAFLQAFTNLE